MSEKTRIIDMIPNFCKECGKVIRARKRYCKPCKKGKAQQKLGRFSK